jgi:hypothetical protein
VSEPYVYQSGEVYRPSITPEQVRALREDKPRRRRDLRTEFRERARRGRERREAAEREAQG